MCVAQGDLAAVHDDAGLAPSDGAEAALQAGLELAGHERVVGAGPVQQGEVELEEAQVQAHRDHRHHQPTNLKHKK